MPPEATSEAGRWTPALEQGAAALGVPLDAAQRDRLLAYLALLQRWNATYNLTAVRDPGQMVVQHLLDCLAVVPPLRRQLQGRSARLLDVGSGGGLPGIVIAALAPEVQVTCVDTVAKKAAFIRQVAADLALTNLSSIHGRVEALAGPFDVIASRAFSSLAQFTALSRGALDKGGVWMAMKGKAPDAELQALPADITVFHVEQLHVPGLDAERCLVWMRPS